jgi:hypothetical protein
MWLQTHIAAILDTLDIQIMASADADANLKLGGKV